MSTTTEVGAMVARVDELVDLAVRAGAEILDVYEAGGVTERKVDGSPVTEADTRAERVILAGLAELAPEIPESHLMLGRTYLLPGEDPAAGIAAAERARTLLPGHSAVHFTLAQLYARTGQREAAIASARRSLLWSPERENDEAEALLESLLADSPTAISN